MQSAIIRMPVISAKTDRIPAEHTGRNKMTIFHADLDNTLIYSYRHDIGEDKITAEHYQGREISFLTKKTYENLKRIRERFLIVPTSTRSIEQYARIDLQIGEIPCALVCNGGVLLEHGKKDASWYEESLRLIRASLPELEAAGELLERDARRKFELRFIENLFLFTKCDAPEEVVRELKERLPSRRTEIFSNGEKVYVIPASLSKGMAVQRFRRRRKADRIIAAGDSGFDLSMLQAADIPIAPCGFGKRYSVSFPLEEMKGAALFSDELTDRVLAEAFPDRTTASKYSTCAGC